MDDFIEKDESVALVPVSQSNAGQSKSLTDLYDRYQKKIYLFDESGSMDSGMAPDDEVLSYAWTPEILTQFRTCIHDAMVAQFLHQNPQASMEEAEKLVTEDMALNLSSDDVLKRKIVTDRLYQTFKIELPRDWNYLRHSERKIEAVRGAMTRFVEARFRQYPDAQVAVWGFAEETGIYCQAGAKKSNVLTAIQALKSDGWATHIFPAVDKAVAECKARPSQVGAHHIVLVSDGLSNDAAHVKDLIPKMKKLNIVFDFIWIKGMDEDGDDPVFGFGKAIESLKQTCTETGGEFNIVRTSKDFDTKFFEVSQRKALPPAPYHMSGGAQ